MKALLFEYKIHKLAIARIAGMFGPRGYLTRFGFLKYKDLKDPELPADDWLVIRPRYCGVCGSDHKQIYLDGNIDNPMTALISWPQVLGHEVVGRVERAGPAVTSVKAGDRVALNPWLSCAPRGFKTPCKACQKGDYNLCRNFTRGIISPGIHTGNSSDATGGFAELVPAHETMAVPIPDEVSWDQAVLADPFSVAFHSVLKVKPRPGSVCVVYGVGNLGLLTVAILKNIFTGLKVIAIARFSHQAKTAKNFGADLVLDSRPVSGIIERVAEFTGCEVYYLKDKKPWLIEGADFLFDTVASPETLETGIRIVRARVKDPESGGLKSGAVVVTGVSSPGRFEWTPWYFKELTVIGSNAFAVEEFEGRREHAYNHYFRFIQEGRVSPTQMISHRFPLSDYKDAIVTAREQERYKSLKVVFSYGEERGKTG